MGLLAWVKEEGEELVNSWPFLCIARKFHVYNSLFNGDCMEFSVSYLSNLNIPL